MIKKVNLIPLLTTHKDFLLEIYNEKTVVENGFITYDFPMSDKRIEAVLNNWLSDIDYYKMYIIEREKEPIGVAQITSINYVNRTCEIGIFIKEQYQGAGAAMSAGLQLLEIVFDHLDFFKVIVRAQDINESIKKGVIKLGFSHEGTLKDFIRSKGKRTDLHYYGLTQDEYYSMNYERLRKFLQLS